MSVPTNEEYIEALNTTFYQNVSEINNCLGTLSEYDQQTVSRWMIKIREMDDRGVEDCRLRNDFIFYLHMHVDNKLIGYPFNEMPPTGKLNGQRYLLAGFKSAYADDNLSDVDDPDMCHLYARSPDKGKFLSQQPIPKCGAFCYMAVVAGPQEEIEEPK